MLKLGTIGDGEHLRIGDARNEVEVDVVRVRCKQPVHERIHNPLVEVAVDSATIHGLLDECTDGIPGNSCRIDVRTAFGNTVEPRVDCSERGGHVRVIEVVCLAPSKRHVAETLLHHGVEPCKEEVQTDFLCGTLG